MAFVEESALAHTCPVVAAVCASQIIVRFAPPNDLTGGQRSVLAVLVLLGLTSVLAPAAFTLALLAVVVRIGEVFIVHLENLVVSERVLRLLLAILLEFIDVGVLHGKLCLELFNFLLSDRLLVAVLMLRRCQI